MRSPSSVSPSQLSSTSLQRSAEDGWIYRCERRLPPGFYRYAYAAADEDGRASGTPTGYHEGPEVVEHPRERPDAHVRDCCLWRWLGDNTYNSTGEGQSTDSEVDPGQRTIYKVKLQKKKIKKQARMQKAQDQEIAVIMKCVDKLEKELGELELLIKEEAGTACILDHEDWQLTSITIDSGASETVCSVAAFRQYPMH